MDILNNSIVDTVIEYANVKFGVELDKDALASNLKELNYSEVLGLVDAIKDEDNDKFADYIDLSAVNESYKEIAESRPSKDVVASLVKLVKAQNPSKDDLDYVLDNVADDMMASRAERELAMDALMRSVNEGFSILPDIDREKYQERDGLEGPIQTKSGKVVYYDPKEGSYYDPDTDMYMTYDEWKALDEAITPQSAQGAMSAASMRKANNGTLRRRDQIDRQDAQRDSTGAGRRVAGGNKVATGQGAARYDKRQDPDDVQRAQNAQAAGQAGQQAAQNSQEIERLKQLIQGRR